VRVAPVRVGGGNVNQWCSLSMPVT
jgi:hypothetical protein